MGDLAEFLLARIGEDEAGARAVGQEEPWTRQGLRYQSDFDSAVGEGNDLPFAWTASEEVAAHIARHDPARVLAECDAKRRIVARQPRLSAPDDVRDVWWDLVALLALPYADHPDFREEWRA